MTFRDELARRMLAVTMPHRSWEMTSQTRRNEAYALADVAIADMQALLRGLALKEREGCHVAGAMVLEQLAAELERKA